MTNRTSYSLFAANVIGVVIALVMLIIVGIVNFPKVSACIVGVIVFAVFMNFVENNSNYDPDPMDYM